MESDLQSRLEDAALAIGRLDSALDGHPLARMWSYRASLEAARLQAAADGWLVSTWRLAAAIEGFHLKLAGESLYERAELSLEPARHALALYRHSTAPTPAELEDIDRAMIEMRQRSGPKLLCAATAFQDWLDRGGTRPPLRAALPRYLQQAGLCRRPWEVLTAASALNADVPWGRDLWPPRFLVSIAEEAKAGLALLHGLERAWIRARHSVKDRTARSHLPSAVDIFCSTPLLGAGRLATLLDVTPSAARSMIRDLEDLGLVVDVSHRRSFRLYGLNEIGLLRHEIVRRPRRGSGKRPGRPADERKPTAGLRVFMGEGLPVDGRASPEAETTLPPIEFKRLAPNDRPEPDYDLLDRLLADTEAATRRAEATLDAVRGRLGRGGREKHLATSQD